MKIRSCCPTVCPKVLLCMREEVWITFIPSQDNQVPWLGLFEFFLAKKEKGGGGKGKMFSLGLCLFPSPNYSPASACYSQMRKKMHYCGPDGNIPHDQTNQSPWWGRRCDTAVQQHTISQSIRHKHMVTNQWPPEDP